ncbi:MAG: DUF1761 domain-containing protein [Bacteroidota bacterium]|nr:DUF1761 domain-containing protein [Bacteroidota bacterium]
MNWLAIIVATIASFGMGSLWYGPLFGKSWMKELNFTETDIKNTNMGKVFGTTFALTFVYCCILALTMMISERSGMADGFKHGVLISLGFVVTTFGINYLYSKKTFKLFLIDVGYYIVISCLMGAIIGAWGL